jgi:23S rRNA (cytidine2498-2'-O)-methyltransferase
MRSAKPVRVEFISQDNVSEAKRECVYRKLTKISEIGDAWIFEPFSGPFFWSRDSWTIAHQINYRSIGDASRFLSGKKVTWHPIEGVLHRRQALIASQIDTAQDEPLPFPPPVGVKKKAGAFFLMSDDDLICTEEPSANVPSGEYHFIEDKGGPPSRAYLKLWEALTRLGTNPLEGEHVLDVGSSPGGWTYAAAKLGASVTSIDGADLDPKVTQLSGVKFIRGDAFKLKPEQIPPIDWFLSDMICDPKRIPELIAPWMKITPRPTFIVTLKFKGECDFQDIEALAKIPGSKIVHLFQNKHELTWLLPKSS